jgi:hypothetical protein
MRSISGPGGANLGDEESTSSQPDGFEGGYSRPPLCGAASWSWRTHRPKRGLPPEVPGGRTDPVGARHKHQAARTAQRLDLLKHPAVVHRLEAAEDRPSKERTGSTIGTHPPCDTSSLPSQILASTSRTDAANTCRREPSGLPRSLRPPAMPRSEVAPLACSSAITARRAPGGLVILFGAQAASRRLTRATCVGCHRHRSAPALRGASVPRRPPVLTAQTRSQTRYAARWRARLPPGRQVALLTPTTQ